MKAKMRIAHMAASIEQRGIFFLRYNNSRKYYMPCKTFMMKWNLAKHRQKCLKPLKWTYNLMIDGRAEEYSPSSIFKTRWNTVANS